MIKALQAGETVNGHRLRCWRIPEAGPAGAEQQRADRTGDRRNQWANVGDNAQRLGNSGGSLLILGHDHPLVRQNFPAIGRTPTGFVIALSKHPSNPGEVVAVLSAASRAEVDAALPGLVARPRYSFAAFDNGRLVSYELRTGERGISKAVDGTAQ